jgi:hypothetical protein
MDQDLETLRTLVREAPPGSILALAPDVFDRFKGELASEAASTVGSNIRIQRAAVMKPGTVAVLAAANFAPVMPLNKGFMNKHGPGPAPEMPPPTLGFPVDLNEPVVEEEPGKPEQSRPRVRIIDI